MFVLIAGGGQTGTHLANMLIAQDHRVRIMEHRSEVLARLHRELPTEVIYEGNFLDPQVLEHAGIRDANVLAACTRVDADNLVLCYFARTQYNVPRTVARVNNPRNAWLFDQKFHVDAAVNAAEILGSIIEEEMSLGDMLTLLKLRRGSFSLVEEKIPAGSRAVGVAIKDLHLPCNCVIAAVIRQGEIVIPHGYTVFEEGDEVLAVVGSAEADQLAAALSRPNGNGNGHAHHDEQG